MAGEASGDLHGANLASALKSQRPDIELIGLGGQRMQAAGVELLQGIERLDIIGLPSPAQLRRVVQTYRTLAGILRHIEIDGVVFIDNPGLNLRLARVAKAAGHRVAYYVAPQIWAWNQRRIHVIKRVVDLVLVILPFEERIYTEAGIKCRFVGHPMLDAVSSTPDRASCRKALGIDEEVKLVGLFPGSREREVRTLLPVMLQAAERLDQQGKARGVALKFVLAHAPSVPMAVLDAALAGATVPIEVQSRHNYEIMAAADVLLVASGTATIEAAASETPMVLLYRTSPLSALLGRWLIKVRFIGLVNLVAGRAIVPELVQEGLTVERLCREAERLLYDAKAHAGMKAALAAVHRLLGAPGASGRAASAILEEFKL